MIVRTWMTRDPQTIGPRDTLAAAEEKMTAGRFRRLPVVDERGTLLGIVTDRDLRRHHGYYASTRIDAAMTERLITIGPDDPIETAAELAIKHKIGGLPVVSAGGALVGVITMTDIVQGLLRCLTGGAQVSGRIDFEFASPTQTFAEVVEAIEQKGGVILGLGTLRPGDGGAEKRVFYLRILAQDMAPFAEVMREKGCTVRGLHPAPATE
jgi:predicted transcriptional regulator